MGWIKRNLFFVIGGLVALGLLGLAGFYDYASWQRSQKDLLKLSEVHDTITRLLNHKPQPGSGQTDNIATANEQEARLRQWMDQTTGYFQPIPPVPKPANGPVTSEQFAGAMRRTIDQLQKEAATANVALPPQYAFTFAAHMDRHTFAPGGLEPLSVQLGEVKAISELLFGTGINALDGLQRVPVSPDDAGGPQGDYLADQPVTNELAVLAPYQVTFRGFSPEIARVLEAFASSQHGFIVTAINVQPAGATATAMTAGFPGFVTEGSVPQPAAPTPGKGALQAVLNEQLLRITMAVDVVKLTPRN